MREICQEVRSRGETRHDIMVMMVIRCGTFHQLVCEHDAAVVILLGLHAGHADEVLRVLELLAQSQVVRREQRQALPV